MAKAPAFQFYPGDWRRDTQVQMADMKVRGVWFEMLCCMWDSPERGKLEGKVDSLVRLLGCPTDTLIDSLNEIYMLKIGQVSAVNGNQENVTFPLRVTDGNVLVTIINRRMFREEKDRNNTRNRVQKFRERQEKRKCNGSVTPPSSSSSSRKKERKKESPVEPSPLKREGKTLDPPKTNYLICKICNKEKDYLRSDRICEDCRDDLERR